MKNNFTKKILKEYCKVAGYDKIPEASLTDMEIWLIQRIIDEKRSTIDLLCFEYEKMYLSFKGLEDKIEEKGKSVGFLKAISVVSNPNP